MSLAMDMYESLGKNAPKTSAIPGDASRPMSPSSPLWSLQSMCMPSPPIIYALIEVYFERLHWFIWIFHKPSFLRQAHLILATTSWRRRDKSKVVVLLTVAALGLKCALQDTSSEGQELLASISTDPGGMVNQMVAEIRIHLLDLLDDSCIETVQVCLLLGAYYIFHGSPSLAWATIGLAARTSYALALHCGAETGDEVVDQVRRRCWNHLTVADTFASQIYGRPASIDAAFSDLLPLKELDDTTIDISHEPEIQDRVGGEVIALTFHWLKYKLYNITRATLSKFRLLRLHTPMTVQELQHLIAAVQDIDVQLESWRRSLPSLLDSENMSDDFPEDASPRVESSGQGMRRSRDLRKVKLQACLLQITHDAATILAHRPLLEYRVSFAYRQNISKSIAESVSRSFDLSVKAALRISRIPIMEFRNEFCMAFIFVHLFTAGVILCIPPTSHPNSNTAQEAREGVFRIIRGAKALRQHSQIARHTEKLLSDLLKLSLHREVELSFKENNKTDARPSTRQNEGGDSTFGDKHRLASPSRHANLTQTEGSYGGELLTTDPAAGFDSEMQLGESDVHFNNFDNSWTGSYPIFDNLVDSNGSQIESLDLPLDEAFGQFGQGNTFYFILAIHLFMCSANKRKVMFNLMPDDPLNNWGWGKGSI
ncbi:unnamed protein product [Clonostachys solani]|uniref:Xylanolytic transcriptional activator regulatory domain-containing protein n=1 Tax=Clonostachys solani TaxID=160281 RepID=A0A9N9W1L7_9HYPO|nr:unnamed protein product [Clonostachys solani]